MTTHFACLLLAALPAATALAQDAPSADPLRLHFAVGKTQYYDLGISRQTSMDQGGRKVEASLHVDLLLSAKIAAVKDGVADVEFAVHRTVVKLGGPNQVDYDSGVGGEVPAAVSRAVRTYGGSFHVGIDDRAHADGFELPRISGGDMIMVEHSALESCLRQALPELPEQPLAFGGSWQTSITAVAGLLAGDKIQVTNKLVGIDAGKATIEQQLQLDPSSARLPGGGSKTAETFRGAAVIDLATGLPCSADLQMVMKLESKVGGQATVVQTAMKWTLRATDAPAGKPAGGGKDGGAGYTCVMHPQVVAKAAGLCPICHMQLVPVAGAGKR